MSAARPARSESEPQGPLLSVRDLSLRYGERALPWQKAKPPIVQDVSFDIAPGETLGLVGESGSGKSTTGRAILRLLGVSSGSILFDGVDIARFGVRTPLWYRRDVQAVFQDPTLSLNPRQPVSMALTESLRRHGLSNPKARHLRAREAFDQVGLQAGHLDRYPSELSGGQQQRVAIARALVLDPRLVVCDEAVSALDLSTQNQILSLLIDLQEQTGVSYLFIAHDLAIVRGFSDRIAVMQLGRMVELAESEELFENAQHPYTRTLLGATPADHPAGREERRAQRALWRERRARVNSAVLPDGTLEEDRPS
jgi:peptide/nickel transport system ATP-binding protein